MIATPDYRSINALPVIWALTAQSYGSIVALQDPHSQPPLEVTYRQMWEQLQHFAAGLQFLGLNPADKIAIFADNSPRWFIADQGTMLAGAVNVVRSSQAERQELLYILQDSNSSALIVADLKTLKKLAVPPGQLPLKFVILLSSESPEPNSSYSLINYEQVLALGQSHSLQPVPMGEDALATLIYTSGTTGKPKGVMLSQGNLLHQVRELNVIIDPQPGDRVLSILPSWHSYERSAEYFLLSRGCTQIYTSIRTFKTDLTKFQPFYMVGVPRLWESLYENVQKQFREQSSSQQKLIQFFFSVSRHYIRHHRLACGLSLESWHAPASARRWARLKSMILKPLHLLGDKLIYQKVRAAMGGKIKAFISGGGALARHLDDFYEMINVPILVGYGLTETAPVTNARTPRHNLRYSSGQPLPGTEVRIVDPESRQSLPPETQGLVLIRGPQVMQGYYGQPEATARAIDAEGWFDSGDLGWITGANDLILTGRAKDTIVLSNGENIEPQPIEDACGRSPYVDQIMLVGQDQKFLGALIVVNPEALEKWALGLGLNLNLPALETPVAELLQTDLYHPEILSLFRQELNREVKNRPGYRADDQIKGFRLLLEPFSLENGLMTQTLKIKRPQVTALYRSLIEDIFA